MKKITMFLLSLLAVMLMGCDEDLCMKVHHTSGVPGNCNYVFDDGSVVKMGGSCTDSYVISDSTSVGDGKERIVWHRSYQGREMVVWWHSYQTLEQCLDGVVAYKQAIKEAEKEYEESVKKYEEAVKEYERWLKKDETVTIGEQVWMSKNLNVKMEGSWCYENKPENCERYGRLYNWLAARHACPVGWHLPSDDEFEKLVAFAGGHFALRAKFGWGRDGGSDAYGFSALPAGYRSEYGSFNYAGYGALFWSASQIEDYSGNAYYMGLDDNFKIVYVDDDIKYYGFSVRCLQNN